VAKVGYTCGTEGEVSLSAATTKTIIGVKAHANSGLDLLKVAIHALASGSSAPGFEPILVEVMYATWASNSPGTNSTSTTPRQVYGRVLTAGFTAGKNWTAEPTTLTPIDGEFALHPQTGWMEWKPYGATPDCALAEGFVVRCNSDNAVAVRANLLVERI
jgi:hypothetical protein